MTFTTVNTEINISHEEAKKVTYKFLCEYCNKKIAKYLTDLGVTYSDFYCDIDNKVIMSFFVHPHNGDHIGEVMTPMTDQHIWLAELCNDLK